MSNLINLAAGLLVLGVVCSVCGSMFKGEGDTCPKCRKRARKVRKVGQEFKKEADKFADRQPKVDIAKPKPKKKKSKTSDSWMDW